MNSATKFRRSIQTSLSNFCLLYIKRIKRDVYIPNGKEYKTVLSSLNLHWIINGKLLVRQLCKDNPSISFFQVVFTESFEDKKELFIRSTKAIPYYS